MTKDEIQQIIDQTREADKKWHLDKRVPIALILAILLQTGGGFWWASNITTRVDRLEANSNNTVILTERVIRLEEQMKNTNKLLEEIRDELRKK